MRWPFSKTEKHASYDSSTLYPAIRSSICTGEKVAGFCDRSNGNFREVMLIRTDKDLEDFKKTYNITEEIKTIY